MVKQNITIYLRGFVILVLALVAVTAKAQGWVSVQKVGVSPKNSAEKNRRNLQEAIDKMSSSGGVLYVEPTQGGYPMEGGIVLRRNVTLLGAHGPTGRGTALPDRSAPTGSLFVIKDREHPFLTVESATQVKGIQFYYPEQSWQDANAIIAYPPTIRAAEGQRVLGVTLSCLSFYGEYMAMDFRAKAPYYVEQTLFEHCYGYPLSGQFIAINRCYDVPRILHCHVNPANMREFGREFKPSVIDAVVRKKAYSYWIDYTDNAVLMDLFTFGNYGGIYMGKESYGQLTSFNFDCVSVGIHKTGSNWKNRNWQIAQGSIIANVGERLEDVHPILIEGLGHTSLSNVECFSGPNPVLTTLGASWDFITVRDEASVVVAGCRMQGYKAPSPINISSGAYLRAIGCMDKTGKPIKFNSKHMGYTNAEVQKIADLQGVPKQSYQGMAIHDDYIVSLQNTGQATIYRLYPDSLQKLRQFPLASQMPHNHANVAFFGTERFDKADEFPLLYVSQCSKQKYNGMKDVCFVERISLTAPPQLVQTIVLDDEEGLFGYALQWMIDRKRGHLIGYGNTIENMGEGNRWRTIIFPMPKLSDGAVVHLNPKDALDNYCIQDLDSRFPSNHIGQGACVIKDQMFIPVGLGTEKHPSILYVWNLREKRLDYILNFQNQVPHEFEDCKPHGRDLIMQTNGGGLLRFVPKR